MNETIYLSRSFVEFGPFASAEMQDFYKRGILQDTDYVSVPAGSWTHVNEWAASLPAAPAPAPTAAPAKKAAAKAKTPEPVPAPAAKKAAVKKAKK